eukprot:TRINITY_DN70707_c0_g1_i1.p1 TRINITY_DN70707_c0_g1~~TRINITY_DN70707_c0_g1_i1.p1  ORF type:complete len:319 (-),score=25.69 TRINITY_DN70707_c0_g1_i1:118-951(-)
MAAMSKAIGSQATTFAKIFWRSLISVAFTLGAHAFSSDSNTFKICRPKHPRLMLMRGLFGHLALSSYLEALGHLPLAEAVFLGKIHPLAAAVIAHLFLGEPLHPARVLAILTSICGIALISQPSADGFIASGNLLGVLLALVAGVLSGAAYVCVRALTCAGESQFWILLAFPLVSIPFCALDAWRGVMHQGVDARLAAQFLALGIATQGGQVFLSRGLATLPAANGTQIMFFGTIIGALLGTLLGDAWPSWRVWTGGAIITLSIHLADRAEKKARTD